MIEVIKQLVLAMENTIRLDFGSDAYKQFNAAIKAGKQAMAELESQEPDYWLGYGLQAHTEKPFDNATALYTHPPQRTESVPQYYDTQLSEQERNEIAARKLEPLVFNRIAPPAQRTEQNFCSRCGKRTKDLTHIHTCTPPQD